MKTRKFTLALAALLLTSAAFVSSCRKKQTEDKDTDTTAASDNNLAETSSNDVVNMAGQASEHGALSSYKMGNGNEDVTGLSCADSIKVDTTAKTIRIHFGGTTCMDGRTRSGVIFLDYSGSAPGAKYYRNPGYKVHVTTSNYVVDGNAVSIDKTITNNGFNSSNQLNWTITANVTVVKAGGGGTITWNCTRTKTLLNTTSAYTIGGASCAPCYTNQATPIDWSTAVISISGSASGVSAKGVSYTLSANGLIRNMNCQPAGHPYRRPFVQGTIDFTPSGKVVRHVDFGGGNCDLDFTVTINGTVYGPYQMN